MYEVSTGRIFITRDATFSEDSFTFGFNRSPTTTAEPRKPVQDTSSVTFDIDLRHQALEVLDNDEPQVEDIASEHNDAAPNDLNSSIIPENPVPEPDPQNTSESEQDDDAIDVASQLRRSGRDRQPPGEWWKANTAQLVHWKQPISTMLSAPTPFYPKLVPRTPPTPASLHALAVTLPQVHKTETLPRPGLTGIKATDITTPASLHAALTSPFSGYWWDAATAEMNSLNAHDTFGPLIPLPPGKKALKTTWVLKVKPDMSSDGSVQKFKARLCAKGFLQRQGIDYDETFAPTAISSSLLCIVAIAVQYELKLRQIDFVAAFLNGEMEHEVYIEQPQGFVHIGKEKMVHRLKKAMYGTKQGAECWHKALVGSLFQLGFTRTTADPCIFVKRQDNKVMILGAHTDDSLIAYSHEEWATDIISKLDAFYELTDQGAPSRLLGMRIRRQGTIGAVTIDHSEYIDECAKVFNMADCNPHSTPHQPGLYFTKTSCPTNSDDQREMACIPFARLIGCLNWMANISRPDIAYQVNVLCQFMSNPSKQHWSAAKRILSYLIGTKFLGIKFKKNPNPSIVGWADADWAGDPETRRSRTGYVIMMAGGPISWCSRRQDIGTGPSVSLSSTHAEIKSLCAASRQIAWIRLLLKELGYEETTPTVVYEDNRGAKAWSGYRRMDKRTKDIEVQFHYTREAVESKLIKIENCPTSEMKADYLTKPICPASFRKCIEGIGMADALGASVRGGVSEQ